MEMYVDVGKWVSIGLYLCCVLLGRVTCIDTENIEDIVPALSDYACEDYHPRCAEYKKAESWNWCNLNSGYMYKYCKKTCEQCKCQVIDGGDKYSNTNLVWGYNETSGYEDCLYFYRPFDIGADGKDLSIMWQIAFQDYCKQLPGMSNIPTFDDVASQYLEHHLLDLLVDLYNGYRLVFGKSVNKQTLMLRYQSGWNQTFWENTIIDKAVNTEWKELGDTTYRLAGKVDFENDYKAYAYYFNLNDPSWSDRDIGERYIIRMGEEEFLAAFAGVNASVTNVDITICAVGQRSYGYLLLLRRCNSLFIEFTNLEDTDGVYRACLYKDDKIGWPVISACFKEKCNKNEQCISFYGTEVKKCICKDGYWNRDQKICSDIDECTDAATIPTSNSGNRTGKLRCPGENEICRNTIGSFECDCRWLYKRTGGKCKGPMSEVMSVSDGESTTLYDIQTRITDSYSISFLLRLTQPVRGQALAVLVNSEQTLASLHVTPHSLVLQTGACSLVIGQVVNFTWHHMVLISTGGKLLTGYMDGELVNQVKLTPETGNISSVAVNLSAPSSGATVELAEFHLFSRVLTREVIRNFMNSKESLCGDLIGCEETVVALNNSAVNAWMMFSDIYNPKICMDKCGNHTCRALANSRYRCVCSVRTLTGLQCTDEPKVSYYRVTADATVLTVPYLNKSIESSGSISFWYKRMSPGANGPFLSITRMAKGLPAELISVTENGENIGWSRKKHRMESDPMVAANMWRHVLISFDDVADTHFLAVDGRQQVLSALENQAHGNVANHSSCEYMLSVQVRTRRSLAIHLADLQVFSKVLKPTQAEMLRSYRSMMGDDMHLCGDVIGCETMQYPENSSKSVVISDIEVAALFDRCSVNPCQNNGSCNQPHPSLPYTCNCTAGYGGIHCEYIETSQQHPCETNQCQNNGVCQTKGASYRCVCGSGWTGAHCESDINECDSRASECLPTLINDIKFCRSAYQACIHLFNTDCINTPGSFYCQCPKSQILDMEVSSCAWEDRIEVPVIPVEVQAALTKASISVVVVGLIMGGVAIGIRLFEQGCCTMVAAWKKRIEKRNTRRTAMVKIDEVQADWDDDESDSDENDKENEENDEDPETTF